MLQCAMSNSRVKFSSFTHSAFPGVFCDFPGISRISPVIWNSRVFPAFARFPGWMDTLPINLDDGDSIELVNSQVSFN